MPKRPQHENSRWNPAGNVILGPGRFSECRMMHFHHISRCGRAAMMCAAIAVLTVTAIAQTAATTQTSKPNQPSFETAITAFITARRWIDTFQTPAVEDEASSVSMPDCSGVYIALRGGGGRLVSDIVEPTQVQRGNALNDPLLLRRAFGRALSSALSDSAIKNLPDDLRPSVGKDLTIELELAGSLRPLLARTTSQVQAQFEPGMHGLAMRRGEKLSMLFPAQMRRTNTADNIDAAIARLAADVGLTAAPLEQLVTKNAMTLYRFETIHFVQDSPSASPRPTHRGLRVIGSEEVTMQSIAHFADSIAFHLIHQLWAGEEPLGLRGDYDPMREQYIPLIAPPRDQALAAMALLRYAHAPGVNSESATAAQTTARTLLQSLTNVQTAENNPFSDPAACAMIVCAVSELPVDDRNADIAAMLDRALDPISRLASLDDEAMNRQLGALSATERGMIALALVRSCGMNPHGPHCTLTRRFIDTLWHSSDDAAIVAHLPWFGWAELEETKVAGAQSKRVSQLQRVRLALWNQQVKSASPTFATSGTDSFFWLDLIGGFRLTSSNASLIERPTSQSARPAALLATLLRNVQFTPEATRPAALQSHRLTMRYLMQLQITEDDRWFLRDHAAATGGIRRSTWDTAEPNAAAALALITAAESLQSLAELAEAGCDDVAAIFGTGQ